MTNKNPINNLQTFLTITSSLGAFVTGIITNHFFSLKETPKGLWALGITFILIVTGWAISTIMLHTLAVNNSEQVEIFEESSQTSEETK